jgi:hypothetical protein
MKPQSEHHVTCMLASRLTGSQGKSHLHRTLCDFAGGRFGGYVTPLQTFGCCERIIRFGFYLSSTLIGWLIKIPDSQAASSLPDFVPNTHPDEPSNPPESEEQSGSLEAGAGAGTRSRLPRRRAATPSGSSSRPLSPPRQMSMPPDEETAATPAPRKVCGVFLFLL